MNVNSNQLIFLHRNLSLISFFSSLISAIILINFDKKVDGSINLKLKMRMFVSNYLNFNN